MGEFDHLPRFQSQNRFRRRAELKRGPGWGSEVLTLQLLVLRRFLQLQASLARFSNGLLQQFWIRVHQG